ncbi:hypothetical protein ANN_26254 [Periplaneta americana]|uniref:Uncharacterized protein n=1 Tax=Periplaneta americana TaxID=6978 RepID=A0ABQ8S5F5_PERAM|nr:hypothetical protein ANN_26254 [Periplaneta americana]
MLRLAPFKFNIVHISGKDNVVADCLSRVFQEEPAREEQSSIPLNILGQLPAIFEDLREHQTNEECIEFCTRINNQDPKLQFYEQRLVYGNQFGLRVQYYRLQQLTGYRSGHPFQSRGHRFLE